MKKPLLFLLSLLIALPTFATELSAVDVKAYVAAQRKMIDEFGTSYRDVAKLRSALYQVESSNRAWFSRDDKLAAQIANYQREFANYRRFVDDNEEWSKRKENAWKKAEAASASAPILSWAQQRHDEKLHESLRQEYADHALEQKLKEHLEKRAEIARKIEEERQRKVAADLEAKAALERRQAELKAQRDALKEQQQKLIEEEIARRAEADRKHQEEIARLREERRSVGRRIEEPAPEVAPAPPAALQPNPQVGQSDEDFTRERLAAADRSDGVLAAARAAELARAQDDATVMGRQRQTLAQLMERPGIFNGVIERAGATPIAAVAPPATGPATTAPSSTTAAGAIRRDDGAAASPVAGPRKRFNDRLIPSDGDRLPELPTSTTQPSMSQSEIYKEIKKIAKNSGCIGARHHQHRVTENFLNGMAFSFARSMCRPAGDAIRTSMTGVRSTQVASVGGVSIPSDEERLKGVYRLLVGLGLTESNGNFAEGRDASASNTNGISTEAGPFQTSMDIKGCLGRHWNSASAIQQQYTAAGPQACLQSDLLKGRQRSFYGGGAALRFQQFLRTCPIGAIEHAAVTAINCPRHYGPLRRKTATPVARCNKVFDQVATFMNRNREANCAAVAIHQGKAPSVASTRSGRN